MEHQRKMVKNLIETLKDLERNMANFWQVNDEWRFANDRTVSTIEEIFELFVLFITKKLQNNELSFEEMYLHSQFACDFSIKLCDLIKKGLQPHVGKKS